jgi:3-hydroxybutyryl-CoA dehydrogenase
MESKICICGAGTMGRGIALTIAKAGIQVILYDLQPGILAEASGQIEMELDQDLHKKIISGTEKENIRKRIVFTSSITDCQADLIIEAIIEKPEAKAELFLQLSALNPESTLFATNTSSLSVSTIAERCPRPEKIIGLHFFNPATKMKLVEIIRTKYNSDEILKRVLEFSTQIKKTAVVCQDAPGFIVNHVARPFYLEALRLSEMEISDEATIDRLMESAGFKMGPFHLMDLIGNDINYTVSSSLYEALGKPSRLKPSVIQEAMVKNGKLGKKTGRGFFQYNKPLAK